MEGAEDYPFPMASIYEIIHPAVNTTTMSITFPHGVSKINTALLKRIKIGRYFQ